MNSKMKWFNGILIVMYLLSFVVNIVMNNYKMIDKIYLREDDKKRAKRSIPLIMIYTLLLCIGIGIIGMIFDVKGIENNSMPAMKVCGIFLLGLMAATIGFLFENNQIRKWNPQNSNYKTNRFSIISLCLCMMMYGLMFIA